MRPWLPLFVVVGVVEIVMWCIHAKKRKLVGTHLASEPIWIGKACSCLWRLCWIAQCTSCTDMAKHAHLANAKHYSPCGPKCLISPWTIAVLHLPNSHGLRIKGIMQMH